MPMTDAQKRADAKYKREHTKTMTIRFFESDMGLLDHIKGHGGSTYVKSLVRDDMEREDGKTL